MTGKADALRSNLAEPKASPGLDPGEERKADGRQLPGEGRGPGAQASPQGFG